MGGIRQPFDSPRSDAACAGELRGAGRMTNGFIVLQLHPDIRPRQVKTATLTGLGTFVAATVDGHYADEERAQLVADFLADNHPELHTYVVQVVTRRGAIR